MSLEDLKAAALWLSAHDRRELIGYLIGLHRHRNSDYWDRMAGKIEDRNAANWVSDEELDHALGLDRPVA
jgi:hypothetical protein